MNFTDILHDIFNIFNTFIFYLLFELVNYIGFMAFSIVYFIFLLFYYFSYFSYSPVNNYNKGSNNNNNGEEFVLCFRKTRSETIIMNRIEEISKLRDIQFIISFFSYKNNRAIKGSIYVVSSKIIYKLSFIKGNLICHEGHTFNTFVSKSNLFSYNKIKNYLNENNNCKEKDHHTEFYTWPYYYFVNDYETESKNLEKFLKTL
jgi:hypothetical protein